MEEELSVWYRVKLKLEKITIKDEHILSVMYWGKNTNIFMIKPFNNNWTIIELSENVPIR